LLIDPQGGYGFQHRSDSHSIASQEAPSLQQEEDGKSVTNAKSTLAASNSYLVDGNIAAGMRAASKIGRLIRRIVAMRVLFRAREIQRKNRLVLCVHRGIAAIFPEWMLPGRAATSP
jgi:hypothetical protein